MQSDRGKPRSLFLFAYFCPMPKDSHPPDLAKAYADLEHFCAYRERCPIEIHQKTERLGLPPQETDALVAHLKARGFLDESRYAQAFVHDKFRLKHWGRIRIRYELRQRGIPRTTIGEALDNLTEEDYHMVFERLAEKKRAGLTGRPFGEQKKKLMDYLRYRGWENELIFGFLDNLSESDGS